MAPIHVKIAILGLGLIGGSLGSALVSKGYRVAGWDQDPGVTAEALRMGAINIETFNFEEAVHTAGVIFVATPAAVIPEVIARCIPYVAPGTVFSDVASIKGKVISEVAPILPEGCYFVPGHPMTGSEKHGIAAVDPFLFENAAYILIRDPKTPEAVFDKVSQLVGATGAHLINLPVDDHDRIVGMVSHLPHLIAAVLAKAAGTEEERNPGTLSLAAGGFRDTTRIAMGSPELWEGIILGNRSKVLEAIAAFEAELQQLKSTIINNNSCALRQFLGKARETRTQIPAKNKGFLSLLYEMVVAIADRPGAIEEVLRFLSQENINIKDIEILRVREGQGGTLRLALEDHAAVDEAVKVLGEHGFKAWRR